MSTWKVGILFAKEKIVQGPKDRGTRNIKIRERMGDAALVGTVLFERGVNISQLVANQGERDR